MRRAATYDQPAQTRGPTVADAAAWGEHAFVVLALLLFSGALLPTLFASAERPESSAFLRMLWLPVYAGALIGLAARPLRFLSAGFQAWLLVIPVAIALASVMWAIDPGIALRRAIALAMTTAFGMYLAVRYDWRGLVQILAVTFAILAVGNALISVGLPSLGVHQDVNAGAWKGMWFEKNTLGAEMARGALIFACAALYRPQQKWLWGGLLVLAVALVILSQSKTSLLALMLGFGTMLAIGTLRTGPATALMFGYAGVLGAASFLSFVLIAPEVFFGLMGKDVTLTGRTQIWTILLEFLQERFWLGYGYQTFWEDPLGPAFYVREATQWNVPTAHNGWLEVALSIGVVGAAVCALGLLATLVLAFIRIPRGKDVYLCLPWLMLFLLFSISESSILERNSLTWVIFIALATKLMVGAKDALEAPPAPGMRSPRLSRRAGPFR